MRKVSVTIYSIRETSSTNGETKAFTTGIS